MDVKRFFSGFGREIFILLLFGGMLLVMNARPFVISLMPAVSFQDMLDGKEIKAGSHVAGDVVYTLDYFASETTYTKYRDGSRSGDHKNGNYYLIPTSEGFVGLKCRQVDVSDLNKLTDETFDYLNGGAEPVTRPFSQGIVEEMEEEIRKYYWEYLEDMGYTEAEIETLGTPLVIRYTSFGGVRIMFAIGILLVGAAFFILWRRYKESMDVPPLKRAVDLPDIG